MPAVLYPAVSCMTAETVGEQSKDSEGNHMQRHERIDRLHYYCHSDACSEGGKRRTEEEDVTGNERDEKRKRDEVLICHQWQRQLMHRLLIRVCLSLRE